MNVATTREFMKNKLLSSSHLPPFFSPFGVFEDSHMLASPSQFQNETTAVQQYMFLPKFHCETIECGDNRNTTVERIQISH